MLDELVTELDDVLGSLLNIVQGNSQSDDLKLLFLDASIVEDTLFVELEELLLKFKLDLHYLVLDTLKADLPLLALLCTRVFKTLLKLLESLLLVLIHLLFRLVHPLLADELLIKLVLFLLEDKLIATEHCLETTLSDVVALEQGLFLETLTFSFGSLGSLLGVVESLDSDFLLLINFEDVSRVL